MNHQGYYILLYYTVVLLEEYATQDSLNATVQ